MKQEPWILGGAVLLGAAFSTLPIAFSFPSAIFLGAGICFIFLRTFPFLRHGAMLLGFIIFLCVFAYSQARLMYFQDLAPKRVEKTLYRITAVPEDKAFYQQIVLDPLGEEWWQRKAKVLWQAPLDKEGRVGERLLLSCELALPENFSPDFNYRLYLAKEGVGYICEEEEAFEKLPADSLAAWYQIVYRPRSNLEHGIEESIPEPEAGLAKGLLLGGSSHMSDLIQNQFTRLGLTHIVAVSGYNIVVIVNGILFLGLALGLWRKQATLLAFLGTIFFIFMIGAPASAVRAGLMAGGAFGAFLVGRVHYSLLAVWVTAALMVIWNPLSLWYDAGFQLSFLATTAVILAMRSVEGKLSEQKLLRAFQEIVWLSVWVYLFLLPLLLLQFQTFTILSIPANILFLPVVPLAMLGSFVAAVVTLIIPALGIFAGWLAYLPLTYILRGTYLLSNLPNTTVPATLPLILVLLWYIVLLFVIVAREKRRQKNQYEKNFYCPHGTHAH